MAHEVFICYANQDRKVAEAVCSKLEETGVRCWIAPRDVIPGQNWAEAIMEGLAQSRIMVLIFSASANESEYCINEVHTAFNRRIKIIPFMVDSTTPSGDMGFYLQRVQWHDAQTPPLEPHLQRLAGEVKRHLAQAAAKEEVAAKEKARREAEAARAKKEAEEKAQEAVIRAKKKAEKAKKEKVAKEKKPALVEKPARVKRIVKSPWFWSGIGTLLLTSIGTALLLTLTSTPPPPETPTPETPTTPATSTPVTNFKVAYAAVFGLTSIDPCAFFAEMPAGICETLVGFDENHEIVGLLAESWAYLDGGRTLEFKLRQDVQFSSGDPFTSADAVFSVERNREKNLAVADQLTQNCSGYEAVDVYTVRFYLTAPNVQFLYQTCSMMFITSEDYYNRVGEDAYIDMPVGTGPYKVTGWQEGEYVDIAYNEYWRGDKPQIESARFIAASDNATRVVMLQAGEADIATQIPEASIAALEDAGFARVDVPQPHDVVLWFDLLSPDTPWSNLRVRQAINYAIDKDVVIDTIFGSAAQEAVWLMPWELGYDSSLKPAYPYNLTKARQLMAEAGYADGFTLPLTYAAFVEWGEDLAGYIASALAQININVKLTPSSGVPDFMGALTGIHNAYVNGEETTPSCFLWDIGWPGNQDPTVNLTNGFYMGKDGTLYDNPEVTALVAQALATVDNDDRAEIIKQAYAIIDDDLPFVPICLEAATTMMKPNIEYHPSIGGWTAGPLNLVDLYVASEQATTPTTPVAPTLTSPGESSEPGPVLSTLTPTFQWESVPGADYYILTITSHSGLPPFFATYTKQVTSTSYIVPSGTLVAGEKHCWNVQAHGAGGWSDVSNTLYFQTPPYALSGYVLESGTNDPISGALGVIPVLLRGHRHQYDNQRG